MYVISQNNYKNWIKERIVCTYEYLAIIYFYIFSFNNFIYVFQGILNSLKQTGYKEQSKKLIQDAFVAIFKYFKMKEDYMHKYLSWICEVLLLLPTELFDSLLSVSGNTDELSALTMIWCYLIKTGKKPLSNLRPCIEEGKCSPPE